MQVIRTQEGSETWKSATELSEATIKFLIINASTKQAAIEAVFNQAPESYRNLKRSAVKFDSFDEDKNAEISVSYTANESESGSSSESEQTIIPEPVMSCTCGGATKNIAFAKSQEIAYGTIDAGGAIGWNGKTGSEQEITGIEVPTGKIRISYEVTMLMKDITTSSIKRWNSIIGRVNNSEFKGFPKGEVMFLGFNFSGTTNPDTKVKVTFDFEVRQSEYAVVSGISIGKVEGFEVISAISKTVPSEAGPPKVVVDAIHKSKVVSYDRFEVLGV